MQENLSSWFQIDTNRHVQSQKMDRSWIFWFKKEMNCSIHVANTNMLIGFTVTVKLICAFVFAKVKIRFSYDAAHISSMKRDSAIILLITHFQ